MYKAIRYFWEAIVWALIIIILSLASFNNIKEITPSFEHMDKIIHFAMYFGFMFFLLWGYKKFYGKINKQQILISLIIAIIFGTSLELIQYYFTDGRSGDLFDELANIAGVATAFLFFKPLSKKLTKIYHYFTN